MPLRHSFTDLSIHPFVHMFVCSSTHSFMLALTHQASQPDVRHLISFFFHSFIHSFIHSFVHSFAFFHFFIHFSFFRSFVRSFLLFSLIIDIFSLSDDTFLNTIFCIRCLNMLKIYFCSKIRRQNGRRRWDKSVIP